MAAPLLSRTMADRVEYGVFTEFESPAGMSHATAFGESIAQMQAAEEYGLDAVWLAELHFQKDRSVLAAPLVVAAALAMATQRIKIGIAVQVLPLSHPLRLAEDVATVDHLCKGRLEFGIGRSGLPGHYQGFNLPYGESRERFLETYEILLKAWTQDRFTHEGKFFQFRDVCAMPKPFQKPHPPIRMAASTEETYPMVARMGLPLFVAPRTISVSTLKRLIRGYHEGWAAAGHAGRASIGLSLPVYVAETDRRALDEAESSTMHFFRAISAALRKGDEARLATTASRLGEISYADVLQEQVIYGSPESVADRLLALREEIPFDSLSAWMNCGGQIPGERVTTSMRLFAERVIPRMS